MTQTSAVFVTEAILLTNRWSTRGEPIVSLALASPPSQWDPNRGAEAPTVHCGFSKAPHTAQAEVFSFLSWHVISSSGTAASGGCRADPTNTALPSPASPGRNAHCGEN